MWLYIVNRFALPCHAWIPGDPGSPTFAPPAHGLGTPGVGLLICSNGNYTSQESPITVAMAERRIIAFSEDGGHPCYQAHHITVICSMQLHQKKYSKSTEHVHDAVGGVGSWRQPLNVAIHYVILARDQSEKSEQAAAVKAAYSGA